MCKASLFTYFVLKLIFAAIIDIFHTFQDFASMGQFALVTRFFGRDSIRYGKTLAGDQSWAMKISISSIYI